MTIHTMHAYYTASLERLWRSMEGYYLCPDPVAAMQQVTDLELAISRLESQGAQLTFWV